MVSMKQHTKHAAKIPRILKKNFTLIFRNWASLILLILGPLFLMFLIGLVFSSYDWSGISVGVVHIDEEITGQFAEPISQVFGVEEFRNESACVESILRGSVTICIVLSDSFSLLTQKEFSVDNLPSGEVTFVYDNSKTLVSEAVVGFMKEQFGITSDQITVESIGQLIGDLKNLEALLGSSSAEITTYLDSLKEIDSSIETFETTLETAIVQFDEVYVKLNKTKAELAVSNQTVQQQLWELENTLSESDEQLRDIEKILLENKKSYDESKETIEASLNTIKLFQSTFGGMLSNEEKEMLGLVDVDKSLSAIDSDEYTRIENELDETLETITDVRNQITEYESYSGNVSKELPQRINEFTQLVDQAEQMNEMLKSTKGFVTQLRVFTKGSLDSLGGLQATLEQTKTDFKDIDNIDVKSIVSPVTIEAKPLVENDSAVYLLFPLIIPIIIVFLSVLFSNIIMIDEIYSKAQIRNFILPVHDIYFIIGFFLTNWIIVLFQISMLFFFAKFVLQLAVFKSLFLILLISVLLSSVFILVGMIFAYLASSKENSVLTSTFLTVGVLFLSDAFIPTELMNKTVAFFVNLNPLVIAESAYRIVLFHDLPFSFIAYKIGILAIFIIVLFGILMAIIHKHRHWYHERD